MSSGTKIRALLPCGADFLGSSPLSCKLVGRWFVPQNQHDLNARAQYARRIYR